MKANSMQVEIKSPLKDKGAEFNDENKEKWELLGLKEKLFYKYVIENDTGLSSILVGVFSAYVVNIFSSLISIEFKYLSFLVMYFLNAFFALRTLYFITKLYAVHVRKERRDENDTISVYLNKSFTWLYKEKKDEIHSIIKETAKSIRLLLVTLLICFGLNNNLFKVMNKYVIFILDYIGGMVKWPY